MNQPDGQTSTSSVEHEIGTDGQTPTSPIPLFTNEQQKLVNIGRYQIDHAVSIGRLSTVFKAFDPDLQRYVSLKLYHTTADDHGGKNVARVLKEARALVVVESPFVARCHNVETIKETPILINEWIEGQSLTQFMATKELTFKEVRSLFRKVVEGVGAIHKNGLLHRDIKPANIIIDEHGEPKVIDLGLAHSHSDPDIKFGGTASYIAPEIANRNSEKVGPATDIFGLGAVLYFMLCGQAPYLADSKADLLKHAREGVIEPPDKIVGSPPNRLDRLCMKCLSKEPSERYQSTEEILDFLNAEKSKLPLIIAACAIFAAIATFALSSMLNTPVTNNGALARIPASLKGTLFQQAIDAGAAEDFKVAVTLAQRSLGEIPAGPKRLEETQLHLEFISDLYLQTHDVENAVRTLRQKHRFEKANSQLEIVLRDTSTDIAEIEKLRHLSSSEIDEYTVGKRLTFLARWGMSSGDNPSESTREIAKAAVNSLHKVLGKDHRESVNAMRVLANCTRAADFRKESLDLLDQIMPSLVKVYGEENSHLVALYEKRIIARLAALSRPDLAIKDAEAGIALSTKLYGHDSPKTKNIRERWIQALIADRKFEKAAEELEKTIAELDDETNRNTNVTMRAIARLNYGKALLGLGRNAEAIDILEKARTLIKSTAKPPADDEVYIVGKIDYAMAIAYGSQGQYEKAINKCENTVGLLSETRVSKESLTLARTQLAILLAKDGQLEKSQMVGAVVEAYLNQVHPLAHPQVKAHLAEANCLAGKFSNAETNLSESLSGVDFNQIVVCRFVISSIHEISKLDDRYSRLADSALKTLRTKLQNERDELDANVVTRIEQALDSK